MKPETDPTGELKQAGVPYPGGRCWIGIAALMVLYSLAAVSTWGVAYLDFGDGNYLYVARRVADGVMLYRDVLSPQPPVHTIVGAVLLTVGDVVAPTAPHLVVRAFSLLLHLATCLLLVAISRRISLAAGRHTPETLDAVGFATAAAYLTIPLGFWWTLGYQTHPTLMFIFMAALALLLYDRTPTAIGAGALLGLAPLTSMTSTPYVAFALGWLLIRKPARFLAAALPCAIVYGAVALYAQHATDGYFWENVVRNQVGAFPRPEIAGEQLTTYALRKILREGSKIIGMEGGYFLMAFLGLAWWTREAWRARWEYTTFLLFWTLGFWGSIAFVSKGATVDYIFTLGEPLLCVFAGLAVGWLMVAKADRGVLGYARLLLGCLIAVVLFRAGLQHREVLHERQWELGEEGVRRVALLIEDYTEPGDPILAPPYYAFITGRRVAGEYAEIFLWTIKYWNERLLPEYRDLPPGDGVKKVEELAAMLHRQEIPLVLLDAGQTGRIPEIRAALDEAYAPWGEPLQTLNTRLEIYRPRQITTP